MLAKILLTSAVVLLAFMVIRQRALAESQETSAAKSDNKTTKDKPESKPEDPGLANDLRIGAYLFLILMIGLGAALYYFRWQDDHSIITVTLHRDNQQQPVTYEVYKYQLGDRSFTTTDGLTVTVASSERMEIEGLDN